MEFTNHFNTVPGVERIAIFLSDHQVKSDEATSQYSEMVRNKTHQIFHFHGVSPIYQTIITTHGKISEFLFGFSSSRKGK